MIPALVMPLSQRFHWAVLARLHLTCISSARVHGMPYGPLGRAHAGYHQHADLGWHDGSHGAACARTDLAASTRKKGEVGSMYHRVFICYAAEDKPTADAVCAILEENRVRCWIAPRDVLPAEDYGEAVVHSSSAGRLVGFVFSARANASPHVRRELRGAVSHGIPILPFRIEDAIPSDSLQYYLGGIHWLDALTPPLEAHLQHLAGTVRVLLDRNEQAPSGNRAPSAPPPGPPGPPVKRTGPDAGRGGLRRAWLVGVG